MPKPKSQTMPKPKSQTMPRLSTYAMQEIKKYLDPKTHEEVRAEIQSASNYETFMTYRYYQTDVISAVDYTSLKHQKILIITELFKTLQMCIGKIADHYTTHHSANNCDKFLQCFEDKCDEFLGDYKISVISNTELTEHQKQEFKTVVTNVKQLIEELLNKPNSMRLRSGKRIFANSV